MDELAKQFRTLPGPALISIHGPLGITQLQLMLAAMEAGHCCAPIFERIPPYAYQETVNRLQPHLEIRHDATNGIQYIPNPTPQKHRFPGPGILFCSSGSTGLPKLVFHPAVNLETNAQRAFVHQHMDADSKILAHLTLAHTGGLNMQVLPALAAGASIHFLNGVFRPAQFLHALAGITHTIMVPAQIRMSQTSSSWKNWIPSSALTILTGSTVVLRSDLDFFLKRPTELKIVSVYGMTEIGPYLAENWMGPQSVSADAMIGKAISPYKIELDPLSGEMLLSGDTVGFYWDAKSGHLTSCAADGVVRSGDIALIHPVTGLTYQGRTHQIGVVGGFKVSATEIESCLLDFGGIEDCAVHFENHPVMGQAPIAQVLSEQKIDPHLLRQFLKQRLEFYKIPIRIDQVKALARTQILKTQIKTHNSDLP